MIFELAFHLHMPVYRILAEMPHDELVKWMAYLERRPPQWRDDDRAHRLLQFLGDKRKPYEIFPSLRAIYKPDVEQDPARTLKGSALFARILKARDGDDVPVLRELNFK